MTSGALPPGSPRRPEETDNPGLRARTSFLSPLTPKSRPQAASSGEGCNAFRTTRDLMYPAGMRSTTRALVLLGPQRFRPTLLDTTRSLGTEGPVAVVTAGWQERESEDDEIRDHLGCEVIDLMLYHRADDVLSRDPGLGAASRERQDELRELQELYRRRLAHALEAAREMMRRPGKGGHLDDHRGAAIRAVRTLDRQHLRALRQLHDRFEARWTPAGRDAVAHHRAQIGKILERTPVIGIAGGNVAVLLNRMRTFDLASLISDHIVVAWSAGAMAVSDRVVLFHDSPPQGAGNAEVLDAGLALCCGVIALPHARRRLRLDDPARVALFARRFSPAKSVVLEEGSRLDWSGRSWKAARGTKRLTRTGRLRAVGDS